MIRTKYGLVEGFRKDGCTLYLGIPFAKPPLGKLAFKHPQEPDPWDGVLMADHGSKNPVQDQGFFSHGNNSLDCLYLNIFVPETEPSRQSLPVMVWIFGGAFTRGGAGASEEGTANMVYDFCQFARETRTIVVTLNYRLNLYGFLNLAFLNKNFGRNNGLYDQMQALRFVKENIAAFGGDSENITVFGQSAGAGSILALMSMEDAKGLFHKAIVQSGIDHCYTEKESRRLTKVYLRKLRIRHLSELFTLPMEQVAKANTAFFYAVLFRGYFRCPFAPVVDGVTLKDFPTKAAQNCSVPLLIGNTEREGDLFVPIFPNVLLPVLPLLLRLKLAKTKAPYKERLSDALSDASFVRPQLELLEGYKGKAWRYVFSHKVPGSRLGTGHAADVPFLLGKEKTLDGVEIPKDDRAGEEMREKWGRFAWYGDPGWEPYKNKKEAYYFK